MSRLFSNRFFQWLSGVDKSAGDAIHGFYGAGIFEEIVVGHVGAVLIPVSGESSRKHA